MIVHVIEVRSMEYMNADLHPLCIKKVIPGEVRSVSITPTIAAINNSFTHVSNFDTVAGIEPAASRLASAHSTEAILYT